MRIDVRYSGGDPNRLRLQAEELIRGFPDVIVADGGSAWRTVLQQTRTIPIVMASGTDPVAAGSAGNIARPEGNLTGFAAAVPSIGSKRIELLKEIAPSLRTIALVFNPEFQSGTLFPSIEAAAARLNMKTIHTPARDASEIAQTIGTFASEPNGGLIVVPPPFTSVGRRAVIQQALQHRLPALYFFRSDVIDGGLMSYGAVQRDLFRNAATYVDRILGGAKPNDLPIQLPIKFELVINLKTPER